MKNINELMNNEELMRAVNSVNWDDVLSKVNVRPSINVKQVDISKYIVRKDTNDELNNVITNVSDYFDMPIEDIYNMKVESLLEYVREMIR